MALAQTGPYLGRSVWVALDSFVGGPKSSALRSFSSLKLLFGGIPWYTAFSEKPIHHVVGTIIIYPIDPYSNYPISHYSPICSWLDSHYTNGLPIEQEIDTPAFFCTADDTLETAAFRLSMWSTY